jgi:hypothetical protein
MPQTKEQRDHADLCGARKKDGSTCRLYAGQGTDHVGIGRCKHHGGSTPNHKKHALELEVKRRTVKMGIPEAVPPAEALLLLTHASSGAVKWLSQEVAALDDVGSREAEVLLRLWDDERDRLARLSKACLDAGVEDAQVRLTRRYGERLAIMLDGIRQELGLTQDQERAFDDIVQRWWALAGSDDLSDDQLQQARAIAEQRNYRTETFMKRQREADELGLWVVGSLGEADRRRERLNELGFHEYDSDRWERFVAKERERRRLMPAAELD